MLKDKQVLLVLDNCEHLIDAAARLVIGVLRAAPKLRVITTQYSLRRIGKGGEAGKCSGYRVGPDAMLILRPQRRALGMLRLQIGPQLGPQIERHRAVDEVLRRADSNLKTTRLNLAAHAWQPRGQQLLDVGPAQTPPRESLWLVTRRPTCRSWSTSNAKASA
jgi:hypothetical protein